VTTYRGTQAVEPGLYLNAKTFRLTTVDTRRPLPGTDDETYRRIPMALMLAAAPLLGLAFVMFLPFIGFVAVAYLLGHKAVQAAGVAATEAARIVRPSWAPSLAFLSRPKPAAPAADKTEPAPVADAWTEKIEKTLSETERNH